MRCDRRGFLRTAGGIALLGVGGPLGLTGRGASSIGMGMQSHTRVAVFFEEGFPPSENIPITRAGLENTLSAHTAEFLTAEQLSSRLNTGGYDLLVNPYGSFFPKESWASIRVFLAGGGNLLHLGGVPFSIPVRRETTGWKTEIPQTAYHKELGITQSFLLTGPETGTLKDLKIDGAAPEVAPGCGATGVYELYYCFTSTRDYPLEDGTSGQRDADVTSVVAGIDASGEMVSAPVVIIDRLLGEFAGGRWVLANFNGTITQEALRNLVTLALTARVQFSIYPTFAAYLPGETPAVSVRAHGILPREEVGGECRIILSDAEGRELVEKRLDLSPDTWEGPVMFPNKISATLRPGFYTLSGEFRPQGASFRNAGVIRYETGFWIRDERLLNTQPHLTVRDGYFHRNGKPYPVTGTSYMSSDVHRKFLFEPNPAIWESDFAEMKAAGINMVRTGIWTGWKNIMLDTGVLDEYTLRSLDAFMLTAARHGIPVIFTFFAFLPESWGGENPYLDPRSVAAQKTFISAIADRYREAGGIIWDLINEPSFSSPEHLWLCRPNYDRFESDAWSDYLEDETGQGSHGEMASVIRERYRMTADEATGLPPVEDFTEVNIYGKRRPFRVSDYRLFAQAMFRKWSMEMVSALRHGRKTVQLVTVGQDEGGTYDRPGPHFFADAVDFTCVHNWWYNDDLLWDSIITTVPGKANLIEESGVMFYETADSRAWRTEKEVADLLERKLAISFASGGAGFINWIWNTNPYMDSQNEAAIGLKRADGSVKPEYEVIRRYSMYFRDQAELMEGKSDEDVVMVIPHSNMFSTRSFAVEATRRAVRAMEYHCRVAIRAVSELKINTMQGVPAALLLPSPLVVDRVAWRDMMALVKKGCRLVISGPIDDDRFLIPAGRMAELGLSGKVQPVAAEEHLMIQDREFRLGYRGERIQKINKCVLSGSARAAPVTVGIGQGEVIYCPLPLELSDSVEATAAFYRYAIERTGVRMPVEVETDDASVLARSVTYREHILIAFISDASRPRTISYTHRETGTKGTVVVPAQRSVVRFLRRSDGSTISELDLSRPA